MTPELLLAHPCGFRILSQAGSSCSFPVLCPDGAGRLTGPLSKGSEEVPVERQPSQGAMSSSSFVDRCHVAVAEFPPSLGLVSLPSLCCGANSSNLERLTTL